MNILVTGGAGYIGSHAVRRLLEENHQVTVIDRLSNGRLETIEATAKGLPTSPFFCQADISDFSQVTSILLERKIEAVLHFAALIEVSESVQTPEKYYANNFSGTLSLLSSMKQAGVKKMVFSSTAAVYGIPQSLPIPETHPTHPINPYGRSKLMTEWAIEDFSRAYGFGYAVLRYFNVAGAHPEGLLGESHEPESHLIPRILHSASFSASPVQIYGTDYLTPDGTCVRDYIHVEDLVDAHLLALHSLRPGQGSFYNLGSEKGFSVREVIESCRKVTGKPIATIHQERRAGDPPILIASSAKIRETLGWKPRYTHLETLIGHAWNWHQQQQGAREATSL